MPGQDPTTAYAGPDTRPRPTISPFAVVLFMSLQRQLMAGMMAGSLRE